MARQIDQAEELLGAIESALESSGLPREYRGKFDDLRAIIEFATRAQPLAESNLLGVLTKSPSAKKFDALTAQLAESTLALLKAQAKTVCWHDPFSPDETQNALRAGPRIRELALLLPAPGFLAVETGLAALATISRATPSSLPWSKFSPTFRHSTNCKPSSASCASRRARRGALTTLKVIAAW